MRRMALRLLVGCFVLLIAGRSQAAMTWAVATPADCTGRGTPVPGCQAAGAASNQDFVNGRTTHGHLFEVLVTFSPTSCIGGTTPGKACSAAADCAGTTPTCGNLGCTGAATPQACCTGSNAGTCVNYSTSVGQANTSGDLIGATQFRKIGLGVVIDAICEQSNFGRLPILLFKSCSAGGAGQPCLVDTDCSAGTCSVTSSTNFGIRLFNSGAIPVGNATTLTAIIDSFTCLLIGR